MKKIIDNNKINFPNYKFSFIDVLDDFNTIPNADLYIIKDVLQHWETEHIDVFLDNLVKLKKFKYILISNNANQNDDNADLKHFFGYGRGLSAKFLPLKKYNAEIVLEYYADEKKEISIIKQKSQ